MKIDSIDKVTSFQSNVSPLEERGNIVFNKPNAKNSLSSPIYTPYKPVSNIKMAKKAYDYYLGKGIKSNVAAGIVGNLYKESGLNPNAVGDKGTSFGVAQWRGNRFTGLKNYATKRGTSHNNLNTQLDYVLDEQGENSVISLMGNQSPEQAAKTFADKYERPNPQYADYGTRQSVAKQLSQMKHGGYLKKKALGGAALVGLVQQGMNLGAGFVDSFNNQENPNENLSAISGFMSGNAALPGIGGILGAISGIKGARKQRELFQKKKNIENRETMDYFNIRSKGILDNYPTKGVQGSFYAKGGGIANPQYEVEHNEVIVGDDVQLTSGKQIASNIHKVIGKTHDQTNPNTVNGTGEDGSGGEFVFSDRLGLNGKSFAHLATVLGKQKAKFEKDSGHNDYVFKNTAQANIEITDAKLQQLAMIQEAMKEKQSSNRYYKFGGSIPQFGPGSDLTAEQAYEQAYKNLQKTARARAAKSANQAAKSAADAAYEAAFKTEQEIAKKVGKQVTTKVASKLGTAIGEGLFQTARIARTGVGVLGLATEMQGDASSTQKRPLEKSVSPEVMKNLKAQGFTGTYNGAPFKPTKTRTNQYSGNNPSTISQRRAERNARLGNILESKPTVDNKSPKVGTHPQRTPSPNLVSVGIKPVNIPKLQRPQITGLNKFGDLNVKRETPVIINKLNQELKKEDAELNFNPIASSLMNTLNYATNNKLINKYKTKVSANLLQNPNYNYYDRSGLARNSVRGVTNTILNNPFLNQGSKQAAFANSLNVTNQIEQEEANRKMEYDTQYRAASLDTENINNMILNQARQQTMANENQKLGMKQENTNQLFQNINTSMAEFNANKMQDKAMKYYSLPLMKRLGLNPEEEATFNKDPYNFMLGRKKMGGKIKSKYC